MGYLRTVLTYDAPYQAEVDKAFLESHGIAVHLLNASMARDQMGLAFNIQLQVNEADFETASKVLRDANPRRFGSPARVAELDRLVKRQAIFFFGAAIPVGFLAYRLIAYLGQGPVQFWPRGSGGPLAGHGTFDNRLAAAVAIGILAGIWSAKAGSRRAGN
jgi:hypothetical protein